MKGKKKLLGLSIAMLLLSVATLVGPVSVNACKPLRPVSVEKKAEIGTRLRVSSEVQDVVSNLENKGYDLLQDKARITKQDEKTFISIPIKQLDLQSDGYSPEAVIIAMSDNTVDRVITVSVKSITDAILYRLTNEEGDSRYLALESDDERLDLLVLTEKGLFWGPDWDCMGTCMLDWIAQNPGQAENCARLAYVCAVALSIWQPEGCIPLAVCLGPHIGFCFAQCWRW